MNAPIPHRPLALEFITSAELAAELRRRGVLQMLEGTHTTRAEVVATFGDRQDIKDNARHRAIGDFHRALDLSFALGTFPSREETLPDGGRRLTLTLPVLVNICPSVLA